MGVVATLCIAAAAAPSPQCYGEPLWRQLLPTKKVGADPNADYTLTEENGPWLILAASFSGDEGEEQARDLVLELRQRYNLPAFYYAMRFTLDDANPGRGIDGYGAPIRRRYRREAVVEHAVLVGEFPNFDDPEAQQVLERVKILRPKSLDAESEKDSTQSMATVRAFHRRLKQQLGQPVVYGPMEKAFITRNTLIPEEYFANQGVDEDVAEWNRDMEYSLLKCPGKYSIKVATFRGRTMLEGAAQNGDPIPEIRRAKSNDPLVQAVKRAHKLTVALRERGWEAYEFHDRRESYVTVGSFEQVQQQLADGRAIPVRDVQIIINTFGAMSPMNVLNRPAPQDTMLEQEKVQQFMSTFEGSMGQVTKGFHPKRFVGLPFDIHPEPVPVPKESITSAFARR